MSQKPIIHGRNMVETLVLTYAQFELVSPSLEVREFVCQRLEEELCALSYSFPTLSRTYRETVARILGEMYPELPKPDLKGCFLYEQVVEWLKNHSYKIMKRNPELLPRRDVEREIRTTAIKVVRTAVMAALYGSAMVSVSATG